MPILLLKLVLTPLLVGGSTLAARRWGPAIGGWLIALPLTSGPVLAFLALDHGSGFAAVAAIGSLTGLAGIAVYSAAYHGAARRGASPLASLGLAAGGFAVSGLAFSPVRELPVPLVAIAVLGTILAAIRFVRPSGVMHSRVPHPRWDLPARMIVATAIVLGLTTFAPLLGAGSSGLIATFPVYVSVLVAFTHRHAGPVGAGDVLAGTLVGLPGTAAFYIVLVVGLGSLPLAAVLAAGVATTLALEALTMQGALASGVEPEAA